MKGAVVFYSRWGNCEKVARAVLQGLEEAGHEVSMMEAGEARNLDLGLEFLVVGSPTRAGKAAGHVKKFISREITDAWDGKLFAAFGTGLAGDLGKSRPQGAEDVKRLLLEKGLEPVASPLKVAVGGLKGPLLDGELERARQFGKDVGVQLSQTGG